MKRLTRAEKRAQTRQALLDAAREVFVRRGYSAASVEEIAETAGYTRGAFYSNFDSKGELFVELLEQSGFERYREMARSRLEQDAREPLRATGEELAEFTREAEGHWAFKLWLELLSQAARDSGFRKLASRFWRETRDLTAELVAREHERSGTPPPADPRAIATALIALDIGLALQHLVDPDDVPLSLYPELYELLFEPLREARS